MFDAVIHYAAITDTTVEPSEELYRINVRGSASLGWACATSNTRFIHASSASVYGLLEDPLRPAEVGDEVDRRRCTGPLNAYAESKLAADQALTAIANLDFLALRYTNIFGVGELSKGRTASILSQLLYQAATGSQLRLFSDTLTAARDFLPVSRVVASIVRALGPRSDTHGIHNLGSGVSVRFSELIDWICTFETDVAREVALIPNPLADRYQYVTRVSQTETDELLGHTPIRACDIREATRCLYEHYQSLPLAGAPHSDDWTA
jgi:ADP-L-glycero-D-manno-heptose 6-epimerase